MSFEPPYVENTIDFKLLFDEIKKKWYLFVICLLIILPLAILFIQYGEKKYEAFGSVLISKQEFGSMGSDQILVDDARVIERNIVLQDEIKRLSSVDLIQEALQSLDFGITYYTVEDFWPDFLKEQWLNEAYHSLPLEVVVDSSKAQLVGALVHLSIDEAGTVQIQVDAEEAGLYNFSSHDRGVDVEHIQFTETVKLGQKFSNEYLSIQVVPTSDISPAGEYYFKLNTASSLANQYKELLSAQPAVEAPKTSQEASRVVNLSLETPIPKKGTAFLNALIKTYISKDVQNKNQKGSTTVAFLDKEIEVIADSLKQAKSSMKSFRSQAGIIDLDQGKLMGMNKQNVLEAEKNALEDKLAYYRKTYQSLQSKGNLIAPSSAGITDNSFERLVAEYIDLEARTKRVYNYDNVDNPLVKRIEQQLATLQEAISENLSSAIESTQISLQNVTRRLSQLNSQINTLPGSEQELIELEREVAYYQEKYDYLVRKKADAELALATNIPDIEIVDSVKTSSEPVAPNSKLILLLALALSFIVPLGFIVPRYFFSEHLVNQADIENHTELPLLGVIASGPKAGGLVAKEHPNSAVAESFEYIRINLQYYFREKTNKVVGVTSSIAGEGKTFCAANLAWNFAEAGQKTLLIGCDFRHPKLNKYFKQDTLNGLANYLEQDFEMDKIVRPAPSRNLDVVFAGTSKDNPIKLLEKQQMKEFFDWAKSHYDKIIVDTPPVGLVADYLLLERFFDLTLFVVRDNYTDKGTIKGINDIQRKNQIKNLNLLFNGVTSVSGYGYVHSNSYYHESASRKSRLKSS